MKEKAGLFLDRDGTIIEDNGFLRDTSQISFIPGTLEALKCLQREYTLFIVTNQPGVASGDLSLSDVDNVNNYIIEQLAANGIIIQAIYVCIHRLEDECDCIKPKPYFLHKAAKEWNINLNLSVVIGDHPHDIELANNVGGSGVYVLTGHGGKHIDELSHESIVVQRIKEAADWVLALPNYENNIQKLKEELYQAGAAIKQGRLVAFPTETVYGLGANALDIDAIAQIFEVKRRPRIDPLIVHIADIDQAKSLVTEFTESAMNLARKFWPGPLTLILPKNNLVPDLVTAGHQSVALRIPDNQLALELIRQAAVPIAAPSANPFGYISPTKAEHVLQQLGEKIQIIIDGGTCNVGMESTIVSFVTDIPAIIRPGGIPVEQIEQIIGPVAKVKHQQRNSIYPGQFPRHYSPQTQLIIAGQDVETITGNRIGLLSFGPAYENKSYAAIEILSKSRDLSEAAANLYTALRRLDMEKLDVIVVQLVPDEGLGIAINDRLRKAANRSKNVTGQD